jgi:hypothetical protein
MEDYQKLYIFSFTEDQLESLCPEGALLVLQIVFGLLLILILCRNRAKNPIIQNSPITTILA